MGICSDPEVCEETTYAKGLCNKHYMRQRRAQGIKPKRVLPHSAVAARFFTFVNTQGPVFNGTNCWLWTGGSTGGGQKYGHFSFNATGMLAHRFSYELTYGPIPKGMYMDHLCRVTKCVRPDHLETVTPRENVLRGNTFVAANAAKTHCSNGHPLRGKNLHTEVNGGRRCRRCARDRMRQYRASR